MSDTPTIGLAIIAKDEEVTLPHLLASIDCAFDQVCLLDTGSSDRTVDVFLDWSQSQHRELAFKVGQFEWRDDFAAARNAADDLLETDWLCWADADDEIVGATQLRTVIAQVGPDVNSVAFAYRFTVDGELRTEPAPARVEGEIGPENAMRERLHRRGAGRWHGRLHEHLAIRGKQVNVEPAIAHWVHCRNVLRPSSSRRNLEILERWSADEPDNLMPLGMLAAQAFCFGDPSAGIEHLTRYVSMRYGSFRLDASWALGELTRDYARFSSVDEAEGWFQPLITIILGRPPFGWFATDCPEPESQPPTPEVLTRQQRRAAARAEAKAALARAA